MKAKMITTNILKKFNMIKLLIFCGSPNITEENGFIMYHNTHQGVDEKVAVLADNHAFANIYKAVRENPKSVELMELPDRDPGKQFAIVQSKTVCHAFMLT